MEFGDMLRQLRLARGLSQDELACALGTTKQVISRYETKKRVPRLSVVAEYARMLGVPLAMLSGESDAPEATSAREDGLRRVPVLGGAACGEPIYQPGDGTEYVAAEPGLACDFALIAQGDSMTGDGEIAAVAVDNELTLKRVRRLRGPDGQVAFTQLLPSNPSYTPIEIGGQGETRSVRILGKAVAVRFRL